MQILITHLTRMKNYRRICVAGIDKEGEHIRPVLDPQQTGGQVQLERALLRSNGGPFELGRLIDLGKVESNPSPPEIEDMLFDPRQVKVVKQLQAERFVNTLKESTKDSLRSIFGPELQATPAKTAAFVRPGQGRASLGVISPPNAELAEGHYNGDPEVRFRFDDSDLGSVALKVTDLRLWEEDHQTPATDNIERLQGQLDECLVSVGLSREFMGRHWVAGQQHLPPARSVCGGAGVIEAEPAPPRSTASPPAAGRCCTALPFTQRRAERPPEGARRPTPWSRRYNIPPG